VHRVDQAGKPVPPRHRGRALGEQDDHRRLTLSRHTARVLIRGFGCQVAMP
jgi:hypothetical protein